MGLISWWKNRRAQKKGETLERRRAVAIPADVARASRSTEADGLADHPLSPLNILSPLNPLSLLSPLHPNSDTSSAPAHDHCPSHSHSPSHDHSSSWPGDCGSSSGSFDSGSSSFDSGGFSGGGGDF